MVAHVVGERRRGDRAGEQQSEGKGTKGGAEPAKGDESGEHGSNLLGDVRPGIHLTGTPSP
jgi:hypothetical protein